jgi:hypothetical protein
MAPSVVLLFLHYRLAIIYLMVVFGYFGYVEFGQGAKEGRSVSSTVSSDNHHFAQIHLTMNDDNRTALRPQLDLAPASSPDEKFQNETLRPILKMQHELLMSAFELYLEKRKVKLLQLPEKDRFGKVKELVSRDNRLRGLLLGIIVGQFTGAEMQFYREHDGVVNRRLTNLLTERLSTGL